MRRALFGERHRAHAGGDPPRRGRRDRKVPQIRRQAHPLAGPRAGHAAALEP